MVASPAVPVDDDDDLFAPKAGTSNLGELLDLPKPAPPSGDPTAPGAAPAGGPRPPTPKEPEFEPEFGEPSVAVVEAARYAARVHAVGARFRERASLLRLELADTRNELDEAFAEVGRKVVDVAERDDVPLPSAELAEVRDALTNLEKVQTDDRVAREERRGREALARAQHEGATTALSPYEKAQDDAAATLDRATVERDQRRGAMAVAESRFATAATQGADALREADAAIDEARSALRASEVAYRDAALAYAEARRRCIEAMTRLAAADKSVEGLAIEARRASRDSQRREDMALRRLREAYVKLGGRVLDEGLALPDLDVARNHAMRVRKRRSDTAALAESLGRRARKVDETALATGRKALLAFAAVPFLLGALVLVATR